MTEPVPQAVLSPLTRAALFLVVTIDQAGESRVRDLLPELPGLQRAVGFGASEGRLSCVTGIGSRAWNALPVQAQEADRQPVKDAARRIAFAEDHAILNGYPAAGETTDQGYPIYKRITRLVDGGIVWAPAIDGVFVSSTRGGDFELHIGQDVAIGYLDHDTETVRLYFQETLTFFVHAGEAAVTLPPAA